VGNFGTGQSTSTGASVETSLDVYLAELYNQKWLI
jgi:hypothetical protein